MRWEVSTFPPHTAAVREGESKDPSGILTVDRGESANCDNEYHRLQGFFLSALAYTDLQEVPSIQHLMVYPNPT